MSVTYSASAQSAMFAEQRRAMCMPSAMPVMCMAATAASVIIIRTDVPTSVSLFALIIAVCTLLLTGLVVLISLSGLTRLVVSLVGLTIRLGTRSLQGD